MLQRLTYVSRAGLALDLDALVEKAALANQGFGVSGLLLQENGVILQVLEGPRTAIAPLFLRIASDQRHFDVTLIEARPIDELCFPRWGMTLLDGALKTRALWASHGAAGFDPFAMPARAISDFVRLASFELLNASSATAAGR